jgi:hypothetical protein
LGTWAAEVSWCEVYTSEVYTSRVQGRRLEVLDSHTSLDKKNSLSTYAMFIYVLGLATILPNFASM